MSRMGRVPIKIESGVTVQISDGSITVKGPKGTLMQRYNPRINIKIDDNKIILTRPTNSKSDKSLHGVYRALIANMITGVTKGYQKQLQIVGVGYRAKVQGKNLELQIGRSQPIKYPIPEGIAINVERNTLITVSGIDKQLVGVVASQIRAYSPPEPYLGKGIRYTDEQIRRKAGKTVT